MKNFVQHGAVITATAPTDGVLSGEIVVIGSIVGVAATSAAEGDPVECNVCGVFILPKPSGENWEQGQELSYDPDDKLFTADNGYGANTFAVQAYAWESVTGGTTGAVKLNQ